MRLLICVSFFLALSQALVPGARFFSLKSRKTLDSITKLSLSTADFKNGMTFEIDNVPCKLLEFLHVKPGKGSAFVRTKIKNLMNGNVQGTGRRSD